MPKILKSSTRRWLWLGLILALLPAAGCLLDKTAGVDKCSDIPPGAIPQPGGTYVNDFASRQIANARQDEFVLYLYEWQMGLPCFGPFGARHIEQIAHLLPNARSPVVIEPDKDPGLNKARLAAVVNYLGQHGVSDAMARVIIGFPRAEGLYGDEAPHIYQQMIVPRGGVSSGGNYQNQNSSNPSIFGNPGILNGVSSVGGVSGVGSVGGVGYSNEPN